MRPLYVLQQHLALTLIECKALLVIAGLFTGGFAADQFREAPLPYGDAYYAEHYVAPSAPTEAPVSEAASAEHTATASAPALEPDSLAQAGALPSDRTPSRLAASASTPASAGSRAQGPGAETAVRMNLNTASARLLTKLPGIGPKKAADVVAYREQHGAFVRVEDVQRVRGIGPKTVAKLAPLLFVDPLAPSGGDQIASAAGDN